MSNQETLTKGTTQKKRRLWNWRLLWTCICGLVATIIVGPIIIIGALIGVPLKIIEPLCKTWSQTFLNAASIKVNIQGLENLPEAPALLISNHQGFTDILGLITKLPKPPVFVAKKSLFKVPIFGQVLKVFGHISVDRSNPEKAIESINKGSQQLIKSKQNIVFFPEGTRTNDGNLIPFKKGAFVFAIQTGLPVVPVVINGSYHLMPPKSPVLHSGEATIQILPPVDISGYSMDDRDALRDKIYSIMEAELPNVPYKVTG